MSEPNRDHEPRTKGPGTELPALGVCRNRALSAVRLVSLALMTEDGASRETSLIAAGVKIAEALQASRLARDVQALHYRPRGDRT